MPSLCQNLPPLNKPNASVKESAFIVNSLATTPPNAKKDRNPRPQNIRTAETDPSPSPSPPVNTKVPSSINVFVNSLKTQGKDEAEILQVLQMCFKEPKEEIAVVSTLSQDF